MIWGQRWSGCAGTNVELISNRYNADGDDHHHESHDIPSAHNAQRIA